MHLPAKALHKPLAEQSTPLLSWQADSAVQTCVPGGLDSLQKSSATCTNSQSSTSSLDADKAAARVQEVVYMQHCSHFCTSTSTDQVQLEVCSLEHILAISMNASNSASVDHLSRSMRWSMSYGQPGHYSWRRLAFAMVLPSTDQHCTVLVINPAALLQPVQEVSQGDQGLIFQKKLAH